MTVATQVHAYANSKRGQQDGNGECWTLAENACVSAGAQTSNDLTPSGGNFANADYVWGTRIEAADIGPGCILQFRNYTIRVTQPDGSWRENTYAHHTSIAISRPNGQGVVQVLHQNVPDGDPNKKLVVENAVPTRDATQRSGGGEVVTDVSGSLWAYRPIAAP